MSDDLKDLLFKMMSADPRQRLSFEDVVMHPWTQGPMPSNEIVMKEFGIRFETISTNITATSTTSGNNN